jgi:rhamnosyltransferase subunit B
VIVHHGGIGTSSEALYAGKPMLVVPHGFDQPDNAARLKRLGVADVLPAARYRENRVASRLQRLLDDVTHAPWARVLAMRLLEERGARAAADVIETHCPR